MFLMVLVDVFFSVRGGTDRNMSRLGHPRDRPIRQVSFQNVDLSEYFFLSPQNIKIKIKIKVYSLRANTYMETASEIDGSWAPDLCI